MALANAPAGDEKHNNSSMLDEFFCSSDLTAGIHGHLTFISVLNAFLSITASLGNAVILVAVRKESSLHPPSKPLLRSLTTTDLCVGLIVEPLYVTLLVIEQNEHWNICRYVALAVSITSYILCGVSLLTMTAISVDRLLALLLGLGYSQVVTLKRVYLITITFYVVSTVSWTIRLFFNSLVASWYDIIVVSLCLVTSVSSYMKIFVTLRHHQNQIKGHFQRSSQKNQLNEASHDTKRQCPLHYGYN